MISYIEIPVKDIERAVQFYGAILRIEFSIEEVDGNTMAFSAKDKNGFSFALAKGDSYTPSTDGVRPYFNVTSIDDVINAATKNGASVLYPKTDIGEFGFVAEIEDSEGNCIALSEQKK